MYITQKYFFCHDQQQNNENVTHLLYAGMNFPKGANFPRGDPTISPWGPAPLLAMPLARTAGGPGFCIYFIYA